MQNKLFKLVSTHPRLKLIWSTGPEMSAKIFQKMCEGESDPDIQLIEKLGKLQIQPGEDELESFKTGKGARNPFLAFDFLKKCLGKNSHKAGKVQTS